MQKVSIQNIRIELLMFTFKSGIINNSRLSQYALAGRGGCNDFLHPTVPRRFTNLGVDKDVCRLV